MTKRSKIQADATGLRRQAEARLRQPAKVIATSGGQATPAGSAERLLHELQVHQVELELQNAELQTARDRLGLLLEKYTDLYDFAPVGHFSLDRQSRVLEVNLTGATLLGVERSRLIGHRFLRFVVPDSQPGFLAFLKEVIAGPARQAGEAALRTQGGREVWVDLQGTVVVSPDGSVTGCRLAVSDITALKRAEAARQRLKELAVTNRELKREIHERLAVEKALRRSERHQNQLLRQSRSMQDQLRHLSHRMLHAQEEERKRVSRELHDEIAQTLVGIHVQLENLGREALVHPATLKQKLARTQRLVSKSVNIVQRFARELRPTLLDDLGLIPTLHAHMKDFTRRHGVRVRFTAGAEVERLNSAQRMVLFRVAQSALTNVAQHALASRVEVTLFRLKDKVDLTIKDNGKSFDVERVLRARNSKRLGLLGMRERVEMVGGCFRIESAPGHGTTLHARIPFGNGARD